MPSRTASRPKAKRPPGASSLSFAQTSRAWAARRGRAIGRLLFYSGVRVAELVALDVDDVPISARKGKAKVPPTSDSRDE
ncbi:MAG: phage integrase family protein [Actinomycetia bacterium]|nr:phage integrase family protein [Actinomycetes bacterium]